MLFPNFSETALVLSGAQMEVLERAVRERVGMALAETLRAIQYQRPQREVNTLNADYEAAQELYAHLFGHRLESQP